MPTVTLNKTVFEKLVGKKLPLKQLKERIAMMGTDLEGIEGDEIHVEIFPNRPDWLSEQGFARSFASFMGIKTGLRNYTVKKSGLKVVVDKSVAMRPFTACALVKNITFTDERIREIMQMQEKLATTHGRSRKKSAYGIYPIDNITFPITYIAKDPKTVPFQPLGFNKKIRADKTEELHETGKKYKHIAEDWKKQGYKKSPFFIDAKNNAMCMLPYTNSDDTGRVTTDTKNVFIECTGTSLENVTIALNIFVAMFADMGGDIHSLDIQYPDKTITTPNLTPTKMKFNREYINKRLGLSLTEKEAKTLLEKMGFGYEKGNVLIPAYRADILHQADFVEDIAIAYGYENFTAEMPKVATVAQEDSFEKLKVKIANLLAGLQLTEVSTYHLTNKKTITTMMNSKATYVELANSTSEEYHVLRNQLTAQLLHIFKNNKHNEYPQHIFEIGKTFLHDKKSETGVQEPTNLAVALCNPLATYTNARQIVDYVMRMLNIKYKIEETKHPSFTGGRVGKIIVNKKMIGLIGEIHPLVLTNFELECPVSSFELNLDLIQKELEK